MSAHADLPQTTKDLAWLAADNTQNFFHQVSPDSARSPHNCPGTRKICNWNWMSCWNKDHWHYSQTWEFNFWIEIQKSCFFSILHVLFFFDSGEALLCDYQVQSSKKSYFHFLSTSRKVFFITYLLVLWYVGFVSILFAINWSSTNHVMGLNLNTTWSKKDQTILSKSLLNF